MASRKSSSSKRVRAAGRPANARPTRPLALAATLTIGDVADCRRRLQRMLQSDVARLDAHALRTVDTAGLQLLIAAGRAARRRGQRLALAGAAELLTATATSLGLDAALGAVLELSA